MPLPRCCSVAQSCPTLCRPQAPLSMGLPRVGYYFLLPGIFPAQGRVRTSCLGKWILYHGAAREAFPHVLAFHIKQGPGSTVSVFTLIRDALDSLCTVFPWFQLSIRVPFLPRICLDSHLHSVATLSFPPTPSLLPSGTVPQSVCHSLDTCEEYWHWLLRKSLTSDLTLSHDRIWGVHFGQESRKSAAVPCHVACDAGIPCFRCWLESQGKVTSAWLPAKILSSFLGSISIFREESSEYPIYYTWIYSTFIVGTWMKHLLLWYLRSDFFFKVILFIDINGIRLKGATFSSLFIV